MSHAVRTRRIPSGDLELAVAEWGDASRPTILLVHGYPDTKELWTQVAERLADRFHVVAYDVRGAGASGTPATVAGYDLNYLLRDAAAVMDAVSPDRPVHLVGHDWGSVQGWEFVTSPRLAGRIASFTSISGPSLDHVAHWVQGQLRHPSPVNLLRLAEQATRSWYISALLTPGLPEIAWPTLFKLRWPAARGAEQSAGYADYPRESLPSDGAHGANLYRRNIPERMIRPRPEPFVKVPVQLVIPTQDPYLSPELYRDLERWVPRLRRRSIESGHWVPRSHPDLLASWIAEFADEHASARPEPVAP